MKIPPRSVILAIADYLECDLFERSDLLVAAGYAPLEVQLEGSQLADAIRPRESVLYKYLKFPGYILTREWYIYDANQAMATFIGLDYRQIMSMKLENRSLFRFIFDKELPVRQYIEQAGYSYWQEMAIKNIKGFLIDNVLNRREKWFQDEIERLSKTFPEFQKLYHEAVNTKPDIIDYLEFVTNFRIKGESLLVRSVLVRMAIANYPQITYFVPADANTEVVFRNLGFM